MKVQEYGWVTRSKNNNIEYKALIRAEELVKGTQVLRRGNAGELSAFIEMIKEDLIMYLRMGYLPKQIELMNCAGATNSTVLRAYPKNVNKLKGRRRA